MPARYLKGIVVRRGGGIFATDQRTVASDLEQLLQSNIKKLLRRGPLSTEISYCQKSNRTFEIGVSLWNLGFGQQRKTSRYMVYMRPLALRK